MSRKITIANFAAEATALVADSRPQDLRDAADELDARAESRAGLQSSAQNGATRQIALTLRNLAAWAELREAMDSGPDAT